MIMIRDSRRKAVSAALLVLSIALLLGAGFRSYRVDDPLAKDMEEFGIPVFLKISERQMTIDATFQGVDRRDGRLISTYDRLAGGVKRPCPT